jgi:hypothetical protein
MLDIGVLDKQRAAAADALDKLREPIAAGW